MNWFMILLQIMILLQGFYIQRARVSFLTLSEKIRDFFKTQELLEKLRKTFFFRNLLFFLLYLQGQVLHTSVTHFLKLFEASKKFTFTLTYIQTLQFWFYFLRTLSIFLGFQFLAFGFSGNVVPLRSFFSQTDLLLQFLSDIIYGIVCWIRCHKKFCILYQRNMFYCLVVQSHQLVLCIACIV